MTGSIVGPTLIDLTHLVGIMVGSVAAGVLSDRFQRHMDAFLSLDLALLAAGTAVVPWLPSLLTMGVAFFIQGLMGLSVQVSRANFFFFFFFKF